MSDFFFNIFLGDIPYDQPFEIKVRNSGNRCFQITRCVTKSIIFHPILGQNESLLIDRTGYKLLSIYSRVC